MQAERTITQGAIIGAYTAAMIVTRYHGPTNSRGSRVSAKLPSGVKVTLHWDHALNPYDNHAKAVCTLLEREGMETTREAHVSDNGNGYVFTMPVTRA